MAKRDRVSRIKSHRKKRNKNPKLSPFQREAKKEQLANQAPTLKSFERESQIPHSQRSVFNYLKQKRERKEQQKLQQQQEAEAKAQQEQHERETEAAAEAERKAEKLKTKQSGSSLKRARSSESIDETEKRKKKKKKQQLAGEEEGEEKEEEEDNHNHNHNNDMTSKKKKKSARPQVESLNSTFTNELALAPRYAYRPDTSTAAAGELNRPLTVEEIVARKKEKKHKRKSELRRQKTMEKFSQMEEELNDFLQSSKGKGARGSTARKEEVAFERKLRQMERQNEIENNKRHKIQERERLVTQRRNADAAAAAAAAMAEGNHSQAPHHSTPERKTISFSDTVQVHDAKQTEATLSDSPHHVMRYPHDRSRPQQQEKKKPTDFYELVDVVRFGERVEAPPTFDVVPNKKAAISRLAATLEHQQQKGGYSSANTSNSNRARLLSGGGNQQSEQKRLERMGLIPRNQSTASAGNHNNNNHNNHAHTNDKSASKQKEMELLREKVMATYQKNKRKEVQSKNGVNMRHEFPQFS